MTKKYILDDLGVLASDLFQSNGIIWVEGPSDRIYIKKWLELVDPELKENKDYTFLYYGGRLLAHYTSLPSNDEDTKKYISILLTNKNSAIVMDSDKKTNWAKLNATKLRVIDEFKSNNRELGYVCKIFVLLCRMELMGIIAVRFN